MKIITRTLSLFMLLFVSGIIAQPSSPQNLTAEYIHYDYALVSNDVVQLNWDKVDGATLYNVFRYEGTSNNPGEFTGIGQSLWMSSYKDFDVTPGKTYSYYVTAEKDEKNSGPSNIVQVKAGDGPVVDEGKASVAGKVTDESNGNPLAGVEVALISVETALTKYVSTDSEGNYKIEVEPGDYKLLFKPNSEYESEFYDNVQALEDAHVFNLKDKDEITNINAGLTPKSVEPEIATLGGKVTDESNGNAMGGVQVLLISVNSSTHYSAITGSDGKYKFEAAPGKFKVQFKPNSNYYAEYYDNVANLDDAHIFTLNDKDSYPDVNAALTPKPVPVEVAHLGGKVTDESNGNPLGGIQVLLISEATNVHKSVLTNSEGNYKFETGPGDYKVHFRPNPAYHAEFYDNVAEPEDAHVFSLKDKDEYLNVDAALTPRNLEEGYYLSGRVTDDENNPLEAVIKVISMGYGNNPIYYLKTNTDSEGNYKIMLEKDSEVIVFVHPMDKAYCAEFYSDTYSLADAKKILMTGNMENLDFILDKNLGGNASISGSVYNSEDEMVDAIIVAIKLGAENLIKGGHQKTLVDESGNYSFGNLAAGEYILFAMPDLGYLPSFYKEDGSLTLKWQNADVLTLDENTNLTDVNIMVTALPELPLNGLAEICGTVLDEHGEKVSDAFVHVYDSDNKLVSYSFSDKNGEYKAKGLKAGVYSVACDYYTYTYEEVSDVYADDSEQTTIDFTISTDNVTNLPENEIPSDYILSQNYPNPFNPSTVIQFYLIQKGHVELTVYNILGVKIQTLINDEKEIGNYSINFDGSDLPSGLLIYELKINDFRQSKKMLLIK